MMQFLSIGECMIEMSGGRDGAWRLGFAGDTLNTLWYVRAGLAPKDGPVGYFTALGTDTFSDRISTFLERNGIATDRIRRVPERRPGLYMIEQVEGDRHFTYWREMSAARLLADDEAQLAAAIEAARLVYFSGITLAILAPEKRALLISLARQAQAAGRIVAFDPNIRFGLWESQEALQDAITAAAGASSIVLPSFDDEAKAFGDTSANAVVHRYMAAGAEMVVVKNGSKPVVVAEGVARTELATIPDVQVIDPTGAGDSFNGAFLAARLSGASAVRAAEAGCAMAAKVVQKHGALVETDDMQPWVRQ